MCNARREAKVEAEAEAEAEAAAPKKPILEAATAALGEGRETEMAAARMEVGVEATTETTEVTPRPPPPPTVLVLPDETDSPEMMVAGGRRRPDPPSVPGPYLSLSNCFDAAHVLCGHTVRVDTGVATFEECQGLCRRSGPCRVWTWVKDRGGGDNSSSSRCYLKGGDAFCHRRFSAKAEAVSGPKECNGRSKKQFKKFLLARIHLVRKVVWLSVARF